MIALYIGLIIVGYLLGSIPSAVWVGKRFYGTDVREHGSKNAGATNTFRVLGKKAGLIVFLMDFAKGFAAVSLAYIAGFEAESNALFNMKIVLVAAAVLGHIFPLFAGFRGGKGVATLAGSVMAVYPPAVLLCMATFLLILAVSHYVSLSSMIAGITFPIYTVFVFHQYQPTLVIFGCVIAVLLIITHRKNIGRLLSGTESKIYLWKRKKE